VVARIISFAPALPANPIFPSHGFVVNLGWSTLPTGGVLHSPRQQTRFIKPALKKRKSSLVRATSAGSAWVLLWADGLIFFRSLFHFGTLVDDAVPFDTAVNYLAQRVAISVDALSASKQSTKSVWPEQLTGCRNSDEFPALFVVRDHKQAPWGADSSN
jgi:hypothetical protein